MQTFADLLNPMQLDWPVYAGTFLFKSVGAIVFDHAMVLALAMVSFPSCRRARPRARTGG